MVDGSFWDRVANGGTLAEWEVTDETRHALAAWEEAKQLKLPADFRAAALRHACSGLGGAVVELAGRGLGRSVRRIEVEVLLDPLARGDLLASIARHHDQVNEHLEFVFAENGNDLRPLGGSYLPIAWNSRKDLFCLDYTFSRSAPPVVFFDRGDDWEGDADSFSGLMFVAGSFTEFTELVRFPGSAALAEPSAPDAALSAEWAEHRNALSRFTDGVCHEWGGEGFGS